MSGLLFHPDTLPRPRPLKESMVEAAMGMHCEAKLDGIRLTVVKHPDGWDRAYSRHGRRDLLPELSDDLRRSIEEIPRGTVLDGELHGGVAASDVPTLLATRSKEMMFTPFAIPWWAGDSWSQHGPQKVWHHIVDFATGPIGAPIQVSLTGPPTMDMLRKAIESMRVEGLVFKERHLSGWWKIKRLHTVDLVVVGSIPGVGKFAGRLGALHCAAYDEAGDPVVVASVGKGVDEAWRDMSPESVIGRVVEVAHEGVQSQGRLRFSSFVRWREDKPPHQCTTEQLME